MTSRQHISAFKVIINAEAPETSTKVKITGQSTEEQIVKLVKSELFYFVFYQKSLMAFHSIIFTFKELSSPDAIEIKFTSMPSGEKKIDAVALVLPFVATVNDEKIFFVNIY